MQMLLGNKGTQRQGNQFKQKKTRNVNRSKINANGKTNSNIHINKQKTNKKEEGKE